MSEKCQKFEKNSSQKHGLPQKPSQGGETRYFSYTFHVADDTVHMRVHKTLCPFYNITKMPHAAQGRNEGGKGSTIPWASNRYGGAKSLRGAP